MDMRPTLIGIVGVVGVILGACTNPPSFSGGDAGQGAPAVGSEAGMADDSCVGAGSTSGGGGSTSSSGGASSGTDAAAGSGSVPMQDSGSRAMEAGTADAGPAPVVPSAGCGKPAGEGTAQYNKHALTSSGVSRQFFTYLPANYDPKKPYPTIFEFHPCGGSGNPTSNVPIQNASKDAAILVAPQSLGNCYDNQIRNSPDVTFFDDTLKFAEANYCVDQSRVFAIGYSAGSWMSIILGCMRSDVVRAHAQVSGGLPMFIRPGVDCRGSVAALFIHDLQDPQNTILGGIAARDRALRMDRCGAQTTPWAPAPCELYQGCKEGYPVVWCETMGQGHGRQDNLAPDAFWKFFSQF